MPGIIFGGIMLQGKKDNSCKMNGQSVICESLAQVVRTLALAEAVHADNGDE